MADRHSWISSKNNRVLYQNRSEQRFFLKFHPRLTYQSTLPIQDALQNWQSHNLQTVSSQVEWRNRFCRPGVPLEPVTGGVIYSFSIDLIFDRFYVSTQMPPLFLDCACLFFKHRCRKYKAILFFLWIIYKVLCGNATFFFRWVHPEESFLNDWLKNRFLEIFRKRMERNFR